MIRNWQRGGWILAGLLVGSLAALTAAAAAGAGHGSYLPAAILFPYTMLLSIPIGVIHPVLVVLALAQFPLYGYLMARSEKRRRDFTVIVFVHALIASGSFLAVVTSDAFA